MKVLILTGGTRGDIQPYVALAHKLVESGHEVVLAAGTAAGSWVEDYGIEYVPLPPIHLDLLDTDLGRAAMDGSGRAVVAVARGIRKLLRPMFEEAWRVAERILPDVIVYHPHLLAGRHIAERLGVPAVLATLGPFQVPTREYRCAAVPPGVPLPKALNRASFRLLNRGLILPQDRMVDAWRKETLGLPRRPGRHDPMLTPTGETATVLQAFSKHVLPIPGDWPSTVHTTGYWVLPAATGWTPPRVLVDFLAAEPAPISIGFGSMIGRDPGRLGRIVVDAVRRAGVRAVLVAASGAIDLPYVPDGMLVVDQVPYDWLFSRVDAVVHHGGAGTTSAAVAAGRAQVVCSFCTDQPYNGQRLHELGVAPPSVHQTKLTSGYLAASIRRTLTDQLLRQRADLLGRAVRAENGTATAAAVKVLEQVAGATETEVGAVMAEPIAKWTGYLASGAALAYAAPHLWWTLGVSALFPADWATRPDWIGSVLLVMAALAVAGAGIALALVRPWGRAFPRWALVGLATPASVLLTLVGLGLVLGLVSGALGSWVLGYWSILFLTWGIALGATVWLTRMRLSPVVAS